jgi:hypothetical protein
MAEKPNGADRHAIEYSNGSELQKIVFASNFFKGFPKLVFHRFSSNNTS